MDQTQAGQESGFPASSPFVSSTSSPAEPSANKLSWHQQKEEQARERKRKNDLRKIEDEISQLETRNDEIDILLTKEEIYTDVERLIELNNEKKELEARLEVLLEQWELLAEDN